MVAKDFWSHWRGVELVWQFVSTSQLVASSVMGGVFSSGYCVFQCGFSIIFVVLVSLKLLGEIIVAITSMGLTGSGIILLALTLK